MSSSKIFTGYRALGFVSNHVPLDVRYHKKHKENYVVTCVGKAFHTYNCSRLGIISVSDSHEGEISCLAVEKRFVFTGCGRSVLCFERGKQVLHRYEGHEKPVHLLLPFGKHLLSVDESSAVKVWDAISEELYLELQFDNDTFEITTMVHPSTYLNKILFGSRQGSLQLWNIHKSKLLHTFSGWGASVTVLEQAPAVDVIAVGLSDGRIVLHNIRYDETIVEFKQDWGPVTALTFRTDGQPIMATGSTQGHIALWNLEERKLQSQMREAHSGAVTGMKCLPSEPLMVTSSSDNSLKVWIFDHPDGGGRLLRQRSGHAAPPTCVRYHGNDGKNILSAGQDSTLRSFSTVHDRHSKNLGRASFNKKKTKKSGLKHDQHCMPPITHIVSETSRQSDWDSVVACHRGLCQTTTWNYQKGSMGKHRLLHERFKDYEKHKNTTCQCLDITSCGNFVVIGYTSGHVDLYNMQSGLDRGSYGNPTAHKGAVRGVAVDALNQMTITGGADSCVKFWKFKTKQLLDTVSLEAQVSMIRLHRDSGMLTVVLDDFTVHIIDIETRKIVRRFTGHSSTLTDVAFSPDGRWLLTASMDSTLRTWDLPTGSCVDCFILDEPVTSLDMSPLGEYLVTTHVDNLGVYLWSNMTLYTHVNLRPLPANFEPHTMMLPSTHITSQGLREEEDPQEEDEYTFESPEQISDELVTLSLLPNSRWQNLLSLDTIKERNKPKQPPKVPKAAPFFLPTIAGLEPKFDIPQETETEKKKEKPSLENLLPLSAFGKLLSEKKYAESMEALKDMGPSQIDTEIRCLAPEGGGSVAVMVHFLHMVDWAMKTCRDYELVQAYLALFLKLHGDTIASQQDLITAAKQVQESQTLSWQHLQDSFNQSLCLVSYLKTAAL